MSSVTGVGVGILGALISNAGTVHMQLDAVSEQVSTGLIAQTYAGLGASASIALDLSPQLSSIQNYGSNIAQVAGQIQVAQTALEQIQQIGSSFVSAMPNLNGLDPSEIDSVAADARSALGQVANLLDAQDAGVYVFSGQDTSNPPIPDPDQILSSGFFTQINSAVAELSTNGAASTIATTLSIAQSDSAGTTPFSAYLSQGVGVAAVPVVQTGSGTFLTTGLLANENQSVTSSGTSTTGSYMRDFLRSLATLGSLSSAQVNDPGFASLVQDTSDSLTEATSAMATDIGIQGERQSQLTGIQTQLSATAIAMTGQLTTVQDVDMTNAISQLTGLQTQLQESYRLIVSAETLSLANYLPA